MKCIIIYASSVDEAHTKKITDKLAECDIAFEKNLVPLTGSYD